jgi:hypothetical protein
LEKLLAMQKFFGAKCCSVHASRYRSSYIT